MALVFLLGASSTVYATVSKNGSITNFTKEYVDSNEWTYICDTSNSSGCTEESLKVNYIYKADGSNSAYSCVWTKATVNGVAQQAVVGTYQELGIPEAYRYEGANIALYAQGNRPWLDCQISGNWTGY